MADPAPTSTLTNPLTELSLTQLRERTSAKWRKYAPDVLPLWVAEMDVLPPVEVRRALIDAVETGDLGYAAGTEYLEAFSAFAEQRWGWAVSPGQMATVADVITGYVDVICHVTEPGDQVIVNPPVYPPFFSYVRAAGRELLDAPLGANLRLDFDALEEAFTTATAGGRSAAYLLCNPHNPGGTVHTRDELERVAALADQYGVRVVVDEIHSPLVYSGASFTPYLTVNGGERGFSIFAASKSWNLAGIPAAIVIGGTAVQKELAQYAASVHHGPTHFGTIAQTTALREGGPWLDALLPGLEANRDLLGSLIDEHLAGARLYPMEGTYLAWVDCTELEIDGDPSHHFLEHARVALNSGPTFGTGGAGHVRVNIATHPDIITEAVRRMGASTHRG